MITLYLHHALDTCQAGFCSVGRSCRLDLISHLISHVVLAQLPKTKSAIKCETKNSESAESHPPRRRVIDVDCSMRPKALAQLSNTSLTIVSEVCYTGRRPSLSR